MAVEETLDERLVRFPDGSILWNVGNYDYKPHKLCTYKAVLSDGEINYAVRGRELLYKIYAYSIEIFIIDKDGNETFGWDMKMPVYSFENGTYFTIRSMEGHWFKNREDARRDYES